MNLKTVTAVLTAAVLAVGMTACNRNAGSGASSDQYGKKSGSAATGSSSSSPSSSSPSSSGSSTSGSK
jgi:hypothetical protein